MNGSPAPPAAPSAPAGAGPVRLAAALLALATAAAFADSLASPFVFDDRSSILENPTLRRLWPPWAALSPPAGSGVTVAGRPILNLSFALNHAISGLEPWSYHAANVAIHLLAGLVLFGLVRRTLRRLPGCLPSGAGAVWPALAVAALWTLHPLQTESVTYVAQRAESLMGFFYLLTLYAFVRAVEAPRPGGWPAVAVTACLLGMGTKEVMASAPLLVLLYDRTFVAGSFAEAWRRRKGLHLSLAATWLALAAGLLAAPGRGGTAGLGLGVSAWDYALTQCRAIVHYLRLAAWPHPLVADYGGAVASGPAEVLPQALLLAGLLAATAVALVRRPVLGFGGAWFFLILAPSSSFVPVTAQTMAEHRMYLPLAAVIGLAALGLLRLLGRGATPLLLLLALGWGGLTARRNEVYRSELALWGDTVAHAPRNARARADLGVALLEAGRTPEAVAQFTEAVRLQPRNAAAQLDLCDAYLRSGRPEQALAPGEAAVALEPGNPNAQFNLGLVLLSLRRPAEAAAHFAAVVRDDPASAEGHYRLGLALDAAGRPADAMVQFETAARLQPGLSDAHFRLGEDLRQAGRLADAVAEYRKSLQADPANPQVRNNLGNTLLMMNRVDEAIAEYREILRDRPGDPQVLQNLQQAEAMRRGSPP